MLIIEDRQENIHVPTAWASPSSHRNQSEVLFMASDWVQVIWQDSCLQS
jgi:hypothetical protein